MPLVWLLVRLLVCGCSLLVTIVSTLHTAIEPLLAVWILHVAQLLVELLLIVKLLDFGLLVLGLIFLGLLVA